MAKAPKHKHYLVEDFAWYRVECGFAMLGPDEAVSLLNVGPNRTIRIDYVGLVEGSKGCQSARVSVVRENVGLASIGRTGDSGETFHFSADRALDGNDKAATCRHRANTMALILYSDLLAERDGDHPLTSGFATTSIMSAFALCDPESITREDILKELLATWARRSKMPIALRPIGQRFSVDAVLKDVVAHAGEFNEDTESDPIPSRSEPIRVQALGPEFTVVYEERVQTSSLGRGTHHSILSCEISTGLNYRQMEKALNLRFGLIWDEDHDVRIYEALNKLLAGALLEPVLFVGERKGTICLMVDAKFARSMDRYGLQRYAKSVAKAVSSIGGDAWQVYVEAFDPRSPSDGFEGGIIHDKPFEVFKYLSVIADKWNLGLSTLEVVPGG